MPRPWELSDEKLVAECRFEAFVGRGPGGQKRHKTNAAVRYTHVPTGVHAISSDSRSQRENRIHALRELRHKLALEVRHEVDPLAYSPPGWWGEYPGLKINPKNAHYPSAVAEVLDVLSATHWNVPRASVLLGVTTSALMRFLHSDHAVWEKVNRMRGELGMGRLKI